MKKDPINFVFIGSSLVIAITLSCILIFPDTFFSFLSWIQNTFMTAFSWLYVLSIFSFLLLCLYFAFGPYRNFRLSKDQNALPKYSFFSWFAMLFSAGMGTGLLFSSVYEPLYHYFFSPLQTKPSMSLAFQLTFLHWGFSGWAIYTLVGLAISYFYFYKQLPFRFSSVFYPLIKEKIYGPIGKSIDIITIVCTLFGVATSLGRGSLQLNAGLHEMFHLPFSPGFQAFLIGLITIGATISIVSGLNRGILRLSQLNILMCSFMLLFILFMGPTSFILNSFVEQTGAYLQNLVASMTWVESLGSVEWRSKWTILYWAWWIAWAPFVGVFIARISEGRTIKEFVIGVLLIPSLLSFLWFTVFGGSVIYYHLHDLMNLKPLLKTEYAVIIFKFLEFFPFSQLISYITLFAIIVFFITSSDSASYVIHKIASQKASPHPYQKIYWSFLEGLIAAMLILTGGIKSLELLVIISAFPFMILIFLMSWSLLKELRQDSHARARNLNPP